MKNQIVITRMDGRKQTWESSSTLTAVVEMADRLNGSLKDRVVARACRARYLQICESADGPTASIIGHEHGVAEMRLEDAGSVRQLLVDALDLHPSTDVTAIGPYRLVAG